ncbi:MAG: hypothetical protein JOZ01_02870 [Candidatus Eremiobacteraeota bacterium]|nr:hypothetical protein [Candidatus Eremiobacteraeota bacterium]
MATAGGDGEIDPLEIESLRQLTEGWPVALTIALRTRTHARDLRTAAFSTREMIYRYLAEQVYETLNDAEREFIEVAALLPEIDLELMTRLGYDRAAVVLEDLRERVAFIYETENGRYRLHDLFREFATYRLQLRGKQTASQRYARVAEALGQLGQSAQCLRLFVDAANAQAVAEVLKEQGVSLVGQGYADDVERALAAVESENVLSPGLQRALFGLIATSRGRYAEAERLLSRAISDLTDAGLRADLTLRLALIRVNRGEDVRELLENVLSDAGVDEQRRVEARAMLAGYFALRRQSREAHEAIAAVEASLPHIDDAATLARATQRLGFAYLELRDLSAASKYLKEAVELATSRGMWSLAARAHGLLAAIAIMGENAPSLSLWNAQQAAMAASRAGDYHDLQSSLLTMLSIETRRGNGDRAQQIERQLGELGSTDTSRAHYIASSQAHRHAWNKSFGDAHRLFGSILDRQAIEADRVMVHALYALTLALDGNVKNSVSAAERTLALIDHAADDAAYGAWLLECARLLVIAAEIVNGRLTVAGRLFKKPMKSQHEVARCMHGLVEELMRTAKTPSYVPDEFESKLEAVREFGWGGYARYFALVRERIESGNDESGDTEVTLTPSELRILRALASGMSPKDIAAEMGRSVYTVQTHVQNLIEKLGCHGRAEAIATARRRGLLVAGSNGST